METDLSSPAKRESRAVSSFQPRKLHQLLPILAPKPLLGCSGEPQVIFVKWSTTLNSKDCIYLRCTTRQKQNTPALSGRALPSCFSTLSVEPRLVSLNFQDLLVLLRLLVEFLSFPFYLLLILGGANVIQ